MIYSLLATVVVAFFNTLHFQYIKFSRGKGCTIYGGGA